MKDHGFGSGLLKGLCVLLSALTVSSSLAATLAVPARPADAKTGSQIYSDISSLALTARENYLYTQVTTGNIPDFLRTLSPVTVTATIGGQSHTVTYYVLPDYLSVGADSDFFRMPMTPLLAQRIADNLHCCLPTTKMVDSIWGAAAVKLAPSPIAPSAQMITVPVFYQHHQTVETQRVAAGGALGALTAGDKKDVVITTQIPTHPVKVAIYGWHYQNGTPIQPLYLGHEDTYADYSHGIRLVNSTVTLDGSTTTIQSLLANSTLSALVSTEGVVAQPRYPVASGVKTWELY